MIDDIDIVDDDMSSDALDVVNKDSSVPMEEDESSSTLGGKKYQKEGVFVKLLPYYEDLQTETEEMLEKTIRNLSKAVLCKDFQVGGVLYTKALWTYIYLYGQKFTKEQHIKLIKLYLEFLTMKTCPLNVVASVGDMLNSLLRKPELLTRDDITIPWRPLYETLDRCVFHRKYTLSHKASAKIENVLKETIRLCNVFFEKGTHVEVIAEFKPMLCPTSTKMVFALEMLKHFLPFLDPDAEIEINAFMEYLLGYCTTWNNHPTWEWAVASVFATAAWNMPGSFDWTPHLPVIYTRLMKNLELPVHFKGDSRFGSPQSTIKSFDTCAAARLIVSSLGNNPVAIKYLKNFLKSLETYYNPSNHGKWSIPLGALLNDLVNAFCLRVKKERYQDNKKRWWYRCDEDKKLTDEDIDAFVKMTSYIVLDFYLDVNICGLVMKNLATIRPQIIVPAVMEKYSGIVETVTEPRKYMIALRWVTTVLLPMISSRKEDEGYDGRNLVLPFAMSLLPAIDPNDMYKTLSTLGCLHGLFLYLPFVDCSSLAPGVEDEEEKELCLSTACLEDFVIQIVDRVLNLVENRTLENTRMADNRTLQNNLSNEDQSLDKFLWSVFHRIAIQSSTAICEAVVSKLVRFGLTSTLETEVSGRMFAGIVQSFAVSRPDIILPKLLPPLCSSIESLITDEILDDEELDKALLFHLLLFSSIIETDGTYLLKYRSQIESTLSSALRLNGKKAFGFSSKIITRCLQSLVFIYPVESRISEANYDDPGLIPCNLTDIRVQGRERVRAGVDVSCFLHTGKYSVDQPIGYAVSVGRFLRDRGLDPIMVVDGLKYGPKRVAYERRKKKSDETKDDFRSDKFINKLIKEFQANSLEYCTSVYEADAQLTKLVVDGHIDLVVTEDSDLVVHGCPLILFKLDMKTGKGMLYDQSVIDFLFNDEEHWEKVTVIYHPVLLSRVCLAIGSDYTPGLKGLGIVHAKQLYRHLDPIDSVEDFIRRTREFFPQLKPHPGFAREMEEGERAFLYHPVYDVTTREIVPLNPYPSEEEEQLAKEVTGTGEGARFFSSLTTTGPRKGYFNFEFAPEAVFGCPRCEFSCKDRKEFLEHLQSHRTCGDCGRKFPFPYLLEQHRLCHTGERPYACPLCELSYSRRNNLNAHLHTHDLTPSYRCETCGKRFFRGSNLNRHRKIHADEYKFFCVFCYKGFSENKNLQIHIRSHTREKPFECKHCDKVFAYYSALRRHDNIHTGARPYHCRHCQKDSWCRRRHERTCQKNPKRLKAYRFQCELCKKLFNRKTNLTRHQRDSCKKLKKNNYLAINDWGKSVNPRTVKSKWHVPSEEELSWAKDLFLRIFVEYSEKFDGIAEATEENEEFNKRLLKYMQIMLAAYDGINTLITFWDKTPVKCNDTVVDLDPDDIRFGLPEVEITVPNTGENITKKYYQIYCNFATYLEKYKADDTDAYIALMKGFDSLLLPNVESDKRTVPFASTGTNTSLFNNLNSKKKWTRAALIHRAYDLHIKRVRSASFTTWTQSHIDVLKSLFKLCINNYAKVRLNAQTRFFRVVDSFGGLISRCIKDFFIEKLQEGVPHDEYKGTLYTVIGRGVSPLIQNNWQDILDLWIAIIKSPFSEKNSIIQTMERIKHLITQSFIYYPLTQEVPEDSKLYDFAKDLISKEVVEKMGPLTPVDTSNNREHYSNLIKELIQVGSSGNNHWRKQVMAADMLSVLVLEDNGIHITEDLVKFFFESLVSTHIELRKSTMATMSWFLVWFKRTYPIMVINTKKDLEIAEGESLHTILQYTSNPETINDNSKRYKIASFTNGHSRELYVHKMHYGFAALPEFLTMKRSIADYSDLSDQNPSRQIVLSTTHRYFTDEEYVKKLMDFWSLEEKGKVKSNKRSSIIRIITRNNGPEALKLVLEYAHKFGVDKDQWKQRCAADILCGIVYGMKLWDDKTVETFWAEKMKPIFTDCLNSVTQETLHFWSNAMCSPNVPYTSGLRCNPGSIGELLQTLGQISDGDGAQRHKTRNLHNRDPNQLRFFIEFLRERFIKSLDTAQTTSVDAYKEMTFFEQSIWHVQWRGREIYTDTVALVKKHFFETPNPYMNVRSQLGRLLGGCFEWDVEESPVKLGCDLCPKYEPFVEFLFGNLKNLEVEAAKYQADVKDSELNNEIKKLLLKFKTVLEWIVSICWEVESSVPPCLFAFTPLLCQFESYDPDPELANLSALALSGLARTMVNPKHLSKLMEILRNASEHPSWRARLCVLEFLKVFALNNTSVFASSDQWSEEVVNLVLKLLSDRKLEVRETASKILCGFLHCLLVRNSMDMLTQFKKSAANFAKKRRQKKATPPEEVDAAHSAILGLCAYVDTHPYHVPKYLPDVLVILTTHLNDPQPIPATIRKCLSNFRRTHHDNWAIHKTVFSEDQLCILTDIFVSPCYYA